MSPTEPGDGEHADDDTAIPAADPTVEEHAPAAANPPATTPAPVSAPVPPRPPDPKPLVVAAQTVISGATDLKMAADDFGLTTEKLEALTKAYKKVTDALSKVDAAVRKQVEDEALLKDVDDLLAVAALSESLREWFPVDPEMTSVRGTVLVPKAMTDKKPDPPKPEKPEDKSFDVLLKELLAHLAK